jgi:hypothetical protein
MTWWIERDNGDRIDGPFTTRDDALLARRWVEIVMKPETFWVREHEG